MPTPIKNGTSLSRYRSVWEMRADGWINLVDDLSRLAILPPDDPERARRLAHVHRIVESLTPIESYWAFPGGRVFGELCHWIEREELARAHQAARRIHRVLAARTYRHDANTLDSDHELPSQIETDSERQAQLARPYFEVLIVDEMSASEEDALRRRVQRKRSADDDFIFDVVVVPTFEDALIATLVNFNLQAVVIRHGFPFHSVNHNHMLRRFLDGMDGKVEDMPEFERGPLLGRQIAQIRPELDLYLVTDVNVEAIAAQVGEVFKRIFFGEEDHIELYSSIMKGVGERHRTPFFNALRDYAKQPTGVFHALPLARGKAIMNSNWIGDMAQFYGMNLFMAETSATSGGLDSLLDPVGPLKLAQEYAARAFGARRTYFATNGTSTCNKIVVQALVKPDDIVLVDRNCHKSHHYGLVLAGAQVAYLDSYPLDEFSMYGAVPLRHIKETLLSFRRAGTLDRVRMVLLTNCTFDGIVYDVERVMLECLAIKPDLVFLWDEAWFAFARCHPIYRQRTGMASAARLAETFKIRPTPAAMPPSPPASTGTTTNSCSTPGCCPTPPGAGARVRHALHPQDADRAAPGLDDPCVGPGLQGQSRGVLPRSLHDPHLDLAQLPDPGLAGRGPQAGGTGRLRADPAPARTGDEPSRAGAAPSSAQALFPLPAGVGHGARALPRIRCRQLLQRRDRLGQPGSGVADRRVRARSDPRHADHRRHRHGRRHVQEQGADGPVRHPDQQDLAQHGAVHDEHRQHPLGDRLPDRSAGQDRPRRGRARGRYELHRTAHPRTAGALADAGAAAAAGLLQLSLRLPGPQRGRTRRDARRRYPQRLLPVLRGRQLRVHRHGRGRPGHRRRPRAGVGAVRDPLPARLSHPGARPGHQRRDPAVHGRAGCARDPRLPARAGLPHLQPGRAGPGRAGHRRPRGPGAGRTRRPVAGRRPARADRTGACRHGVPAAKKPVSRSKK